MILLIALALHSQAFCGRALFFNQSPSFAYALAGDATRLYQKTEDRQSVITYDEIESHERDMQQFYLDSYMDYVRLIAREIVALCDAAPHAELLKAGKQGIFDAMKSYNDRLHPSIDQHFISIIKMRMIAILTGPQYAPKVRPKTLQQIQKKLQMAT